jgi:hypothetical protein
MKLSFLVVILFSVANAVANDLDFTLVNQTGRSFEGLYITASDNGNVLAAGGRISVRFKSEARAETWDFNVVDDEGLSVTFEKVKLTGVEAVTLKDVNGRITAEVE